MCTSKNKTKDPEVEVAEDLIFLLAVQALMELEKGAQALPANTSVEVEAEQI